MSTTAVITFKDGDDSFAIYQHYDATPLAVAVAVFRARQFAWPLPRFEAGDFAAAYIRASKVGGGNIYLSNGGHIDLAFSYIVTRNDDNDLSLSIGRPRTLFSYTYIILPEGIQAPPLRQAEISLVTNQPFPSTSQMALQP